MDSSSGGGGGGGGGGAVIAPTTDASGLVILFAAAGVDNAGRLGSGGGGLKPPSSSFPARLRSGDQAFGSFLLLKMVCFLRRTLRIFDLVEKKEKKTSLMMYFVA